MPAVLTDDRLCSNVVPSAWQNLLQSLSTFISIEEELSRASEPMERDRLQAAIEELHARLMHDSIQLLEPEALSDLPPQTSERVFARAVLMLTRLRDCVAGDIAVLDTAGSKTLVHFEPDLLETPEAAAKIRSALRKFSALSPEDFAAIEEEVAVDVEDAQRKQSVIGALRDEFGLYEDAPDLQANILRCFEVCYPDSGLISAEVEIILTGCMIFFCLPFEEGYQYSSSRADLLDEDHRQKIEKFFKRLRTFAHWQFAHFPVFGFFRGESLPEPLLRRLAERAQLTTAQTAYELSRLVAIVPESEVDKYVVHDVWGHSWQASMLHYDRMYEELSTYGDAPRLSTSVAQATTPIHTLGDCFDRQGTDCQLNREAFERFATTLVIERLPIAVTPAIAELIADVAEYKLLALRPEHEQDLPSSSWLKHHPSKLDLVLKDVHFYFQQATKIWRRWARSQQQQTALIDELIAEGVKSTAAEAAVAEAVAAWNHLVHERFAARLHWSESAEDDMITVNVFTRVALNFLGIHRATLVAYEAINQLNVTKLPLRSFRDLLLLSAAVFFENEPTRNLWRVDEFLTLRIEPLCQALAASIRGEDDA